MTPDPLESESPYHLSSRTTPTWEMELLVSGATVFSLMQLPPLVDRVMFSVFNTAAAGVAGLALPLWIYIKFALLVLIATFVFHLCLRGYWVALAGLHSVYPDGVRWDKLGKRSGPIGLQVAKESFGDLPTVIERADNRASRVFGVGFGMAMMMLVPTAIVSVLMAGIWAYGAAGGRVDSPMAGFVVVFVAMLLPLALAAGWDRFYGARHADRPLGRFVRRVYRAYGAMGFGRTSNPLLAVFSSNEGGPRTGALLAFVMIAVLGIVVLQAIGPRLGIEMGRYAGLPDERAGTGDVLLARHYASQRDKAATLAPPPHIADPIVRGGYVRLFIPYFPQRHDAGMARLCPEAMSDTGDTGPRARLDCLARMHAVAVDGVPSTVPFDAAEDPATGQRGMLATIPVRDLPPGRHELTVMPAPRSPEREAKDPARPYRIPFWN
jgi:hypothetical protein